MNIAVSFLYVKQIKCKLLSCCRYCRKLHEKMNVIVLSQVVTFLLYPVPIMYGCGKAATILYSPLDRWFWIFDVQIPSTKIPWNLSHPNPAVFFHLHGCLVSDIDFFVVRYKFKNWNQKYVWCFMPRYKESQFFNCLLAGHFPLFVLSFIFWFSLPIESPMGWTGQYMSTPPKSWCTMKNH